MRTDKTALVTADAFCFIPRGNFYSRAAFFISRAAERESAVRELLHLADSQTFALLTVHNVLNFADKFRNVVRRLALSFALRVDVPAANIDFVQCLNTSVNRAAVHFDNLRAFLAVRFFNRVLEIFNSLINRNNISQLEESRLHNHVETTAEPQLARNFHRVDRVNIYIIFGDIFFHVRGKFAPEFFVAPIGIQKESTALFHARNQIVMVNITFLTAGNKIGLGDEIRRSYRGFAETQMAHGNAAGFFRVVSKISLRVKVGIVADNFNGGFICADCAVRAETPEFTSGRPFGR